MSLKEVLKSKGVKQSDVAAKLGIPKSTFSMWVNNRRTMGFDDAIMLADYLDCSLDELAGRETPTRTLSEFERKMIDVFNAANAEGKKNIEMMIDYVGDNPKFRKKSNQVQTA